MKIGLTLLLIIAFAFAFKNIQATKNPKVKATTEIVNNDEGKKLYKIYCVACHGKDGRQEFNGAKDFAKSTMTLEERIIIIREGRKMMTPFKGMLKEKEIEAIAGYTLKLSKGEP